MDSKKSVVSVSPSTRLYGDCDGNYPGKTLGELTNESVFLVVDYRKGHKKPYLLAGEYTTQLGWVSL